MEQSRFLIRSLSLSPPAIFPSASSWNFNRPAHAALDYLLDTFVIWLNPICPARRTCLKCAIIARLPLSAKHRSGLPREAYCDFVDAPRRDIIQPFRLPSDAIIIRKVNEIAIKFSSYTFF